MGLWFVLFHVGGFFSKVGYLWQSIHIKEQEVCARVRTHTQTHTLVGVGIWAVLLISVFIRRFLEWFPPFHGWISRCLYLYIFCLQLINLSREESFNFLFEG